MSLPDWFKDPDTSRWPPEAKAAYGIMAAVALRRSQAEGQSEPSSSPKAYTVREAAEVLQASEDQVYRLIKDGKLPAISLGRGAIRPRGLRISAQALQTFLNGGGS